MKWQPLKTAPRDETKILVVWLGQATMATWNLKVGNWQEWPDGDFDNGGEVTAWMPLPEVHEEIDNADI